MSESAPASYKQKDHRYLLEQAAYWEIKAEDAQRAVDYAKKQRRLALIALGMLGDEEI